MLAAMTRRKTLREAQTAGGLRRTLTALDLILYGVGSSVGAGIFVLVGLGAKVAGPAIGVSFLLTGMACILTSLAYAEFASRIPVAGSAFTYVYVAFGEFWAWIVGWNLLLGYGFTASVCSRAWADYTGDFLVKTTHQEWIGSLTEWRVYGDYSCSPLSVVIIALGTWVLLKGAEESSKFNNIVTVMNIANLLLVVLSGIVSESIDPENWQPFAPKGLPGVIQGAGLVFFAYIGFDMVASLSEEVIHPERNMPIGIVGSLIVSTFIYVFVAMAVVGMAPISLLGESVPIINALSANACCSHVEQLAVNAKSVCLSSSTCGGWLVVIARVVSGGAIAGLVASSFTSLMGTPRILMRMSLDGLWFKLFSKINPVTQVPSAGIWATGIATSLLACFAPLEGLANLISLGTLMVFTFVDAGVILLRLRTIAETDARELVSKAEQRDRMGQFYILNQQIAVLLFVCTVSVVMASILLTNTDRSFLVSFFLVVAVIAGALIRWLPMSWSCSSSSSCTSHAHSAFSCPWVPAIPLGGLACNAAMMGSLPLSSWVFALIWISCGVAIYFLYGIHNSALGKATAGEEAPLLISPSLPQSCDSHTSLPLLTPHLPRPNPHERIN